MDQITLKVPPDVLETLDEEAEEAGVSRSEHLRNIIESRHDSDELRKTIDELRTKVERLEREKRLILEDREEKQELVRFAEAERSLQERRLRASLVERAKWAVFGMDDDER